MPFFQGLTSYYSSAKNLITSTAQSIWKSDIGQAMWQGFTAPYNNYKSWRDMVNNSEDLRTSNRRSFEFNIGYAMQSLIAYMLYYRAVHADLDDRYKKQDESSWSGTITQTAISTTDNFCWVLINLYLMHLWLNSIVENFGFTSAITSDASKAMRPSDDFKPCDCDRTQVVKGSGESLAFYVGSRYLANKISYVAVNHISGWKSGLFVFGLESAVLGIPLLEYKFSASGRCGEHRYVDILSSHKMYAFWLGVSFVAATWSTYKVLSTISGGDSPYIYDYVFSSMFQMYLQLIISREKKFPGNDKVTIDIVGWFNYLIKTKPVQYFLEKFLGNLYSLEKLVQTPGVGLLLTVHGSEIKESLTTVKDSLQQVKDIQNNRLYSTAKWLSSWLPNNYVPDELKTIGKSISKKALTKTIKKTERLLEIAKNAEEKRMTQKRIEDKAIVVSEPENKSILIAEPSVTATPAPKVILIPEQKLEEKPAPPALLVVDDDYVNKKTKSEVKIEAKPFPPKRGPGLFQKDFLQRAHSLKRDGPLAVMTTSIISKSGTKTTVLR